MTRVKRPKGRYDQFIEIKERAEQQHAPGLVERLKLLKMQAGAIQKNKDRLSKEQAAIGKQIEEVTRQLRSTRRFEVTDHAVVRYLERVRGFDIESLRQRVADFAKKNPSECIISEDGLLITVIPNEQVRPKQVSVL